MATALREIIPDWSLDEGVNNRLDGDLLARAYRFSEEAHRGQTRNSGDPYVTHCVEVAKILADLQLDTITVASGLIHDVVEDTKITVADVDSAATFVARTSSQGNATVRAPVSNRT